MKGSFEVPVNHLYDFDSDQDYLFVLAHLCDNPLYKSYVMASNKYKILDNSAYELRRSISVDALLDLAEELRADVVVVPDVLADASETLKMTSEFYNKLTSRSLKIKTMVVPQGRTSAEYYACLNKMRSFPFDMIGVSFYAPGLDPRQCEDLRFQRISSIVRGYPDVKIHLLGLANSAFLTEYRKYLNIISFDTSFPIVYGYYKEIVTPTSLKKQRPSNFFELRLDNDSIKIARQNIVILKHIVNG